MKTSLFIENRNKIFSLIDRVRELKLLLKGLEEDSLNNKNLFSFDRLSTTIIINNIYITTDNKNKIRKAIVKEIKSEIKIRTKELKLMGFEIDE